MSTSLDLNDVLQTIVGTAMSLVGAENCFIFEMDHERRKLRILSMMTQWSFDPNIELDLNEGLVGAVASTGQASWPCGPIWTPGPSAWRERPHAQLHDRGAADLQRPRAGVMSLRRCRELFDRSQYELIELFSAQASMAINNAYMFGDLQRTASTLQMLNVLLTHDVATSTRPSTAKLRDTSCASRRWTIGSAAMCARHWCNRATYRS